MTILCFSWAAAAGHSKIGHEALGASDFAEVDAEHLIVDAEALVVAEVPVAKIDPDGASAEKEYCQCLDSTLEHTVAALACCIGP